ncbi:MAG: hypothetical protein COW84_03455 [Gammaproteobacteria bacterium CG22_combo_CG10-13_8_21_14_all_40_8]|nr:MAG: hypothetical protein COW84_03455 [Gammaproteobacteria bacterium CG22_combo_CG10-13_8_21_14_all_40_8]
MKKTTPSLMTKPSTEELSNEQVIALTGGTGFIGANILSHLSQCGWKVRALYRPKKNQNLTRIKNVEWVSGSLNDSESIKNLVSGTSAVIHCAGAVRGATQQDFDKVNEQGSLQIAQAICQQSPMPRLLLISSLAAREPLLSHYAASKWRGECAIKSVSEQLRWTILRPPAVFGPGDKELLPLFRSIANGLAPLPAGADRRFSMIYVDDIATAVSSWLNADKGYSETFELDDGKQGGYDWDTVLSICGNVLREGSYIQRIPIPILLLNLFALTNLTAAKLLGYAPMLTPGKVRELTHPDWICDSQEFMRITGWKPAMNLEQGLACIFGKNLNQLEES